MDEFYKNEKARCAINECGMSEGVLLMVMSAHRSERRCENDEKRQSTQIRFLYQSILGLQERHENRC